MHSGYPIMCPVQSVPVFLDEKIIRSKGIRGLFHEMGHNLQHSGWIIHPHTSEAMCNLWSGIIHPVNYVQDPLGTISKILNHDTLLLVNGIITSVPLGSQCMDSRSNATTPCGLLLQGFAESPHLRPVLFLLLLAVHLATLSGNLLILVAVASVPSRPPMLLFLCQLSAIELCYMLAVVPRSLAQLASPGRGRDSPISFLGCAVQMHMFVALGGAQCFLLAAMACDRYMAICHPLRYVAVVTPGLCTRLALACCLGELAVRKAASTCASHLAVTFLHHGCPTFTYVWPKASYSPRQDRTLALVYTNVTPLLYPLIYSLRNRKITATIRRVLSPRAGSV
ncbi:hypothetical protein E2I00_007412 [Balaenoptera physalus]|uniref:G-protein coupled receptors family 1 profile domain-containing protein n=1 Tax=Balaenoptera physalus TaxID=9770 RepID=A0A6A1Q7X4_BALPH|nr:hypothetical protein E2I00_007412 [Balaenoptera physalus]